MYIIFIIMLLFRTQKRQREQEKIQLWVEERIQRDEIARRRMTSVCMTDEQINHLKNTKLRVKEIKQQQRQQWLNQKIFQIIL